VDLGRLVRVVLRVEPVRMGDVGVVGGLLVVARGVGLGRVMVVPRGVLMVRGRVPVVLDLLLVGHVVFFVEG
jgi:hypothetical protein